MCGQFQSSAVSSALFWGKQGETKLTASMDCCAEAQSVSLNFDGDNLFDHDRSHYLGDQTKSEQPGS